MIDCDAHASLCRRNDVASYPTLRFRPARSSTLFVFGENADEGVAEDADAAAAAAAISVESLTAFVSGGYASASVYARPFSTGNDAVDEVLRQLRYLATHHASACVLIYALGVLTGSLLNRLRRARGAEKQKST